jgi:hypothetical protein
MGKKSIMINLGKILMHKLENSNRQLISQMESRDFPLHQIIRYFGHF